MFGKMINSYTLLLCHFVGDYILQSDWMALNKSKQTVPCFIHVCLYSLCFVPFVSFHALLFIAITHFLIDRFSLAKYLCYMKNHLNPSFKFFPWSTCNITGYNDQGENPSRPFWLTLILYIVADNTLHLICNEYAKTL